MKILFIANAIVGENPGLTGGEVRFIEIAKSWADKGYEIHLMSAKGGERLCNKFGLEVTLYSISDSKKTGRFTFILRALQSLFFLPASLKDFKGGIIYSTNEMIVDVIPALRLKLRNRRNIKWATVVHWLPPFPPWKRKESTFINSTFFFINERLSVWLSNRFADFLLPVSPMTARQLSRVGADMKKVHPVECGVNYTEIREIVQKVKAKRYDGVFMKRLQAVKGIFDIIDIWERVVRIRKDAKLLIIGEGIDAQRAKEMVKERNLENNIEFSGVIYDVKEKFRRLAQSRLFLLPSYEENWAIAMGEALAVGIPVLAYGLKELIDVWEDNFLSIPVGDKERFAQEIIKYLNNHSLRESLARKGLGYVTRYDWKEIADKELNLICF